MAARRWDRAGVRALVEDAGFSIQTMTAFTSLLSPLIVPLALWERSLQGRGKSDAGHHDIAPLSGASAAVVDAVLATERAILRRCALPLGTTWLIVARAS